MTENRWNTATRMVLVVAIVIAVGFGQYQYKRVNELEAQNKAIAEAVFNIFCYIAERDGRYEESCYGSF